MCRFCTGVICAVARLSPNHLVYVVGARCAHRNSSGVWMPAHKLGFSRFTFIIYEADNDRLTVNVRAGAAVDAAGNPTLPPQQYTVYKWPGWFTTVGAWAPLISWSACISHRQLHHRILARWCGPGGSHHRARAAACILASSVHAPAVSWPCFLGIHVGRARRSCRCVVAHSKHHTRPGVAQYAFFSVVVVVVCVCVCVCRCVCVCVCVLGFVT